MHHGVKGGTQTDQSLLDTRALKSWVVVDGMVVAVQRALHRSEHLLRVAVVAAVTGRYWIWEQAVEVALVVVVEVVVLRFSRFHRAVRRFERAGTSAQPTVVSVQKRHRAEDAVLQGVGNCYRAVWQGLEMGRREVLMVLFEVEWTVASFDRGGEMAVVVVTVVFLMVMLV